MRWKRLLETIEEMVSHPLVLDVLEDWEMAGSLRRGICHMLTTSHVSLCRQREVLNELRTSTIVKSWVHADARNTRRSSSSSLRFSYALIRLGARIAISGHVAYGAAPSLGDSLPS